MIVGATALETSISTKSYRLRRSMYFEPVWAVKLDVVPCGLERLGRCVDIDKYPRCYGDGAPTDSAPSRAR